MDNLPQLGFWSLLPLAVAIVMAFKTRSAIFSLLFGVVCGTVMLSVFSVHHSAYPLSSLSDVFQQALGNHSFVWIVLMVCLIVQTSKPVASKFEWTEREQRTDLMNRCEYTFH